MQKFDSINVIPFIDIMLVLLAIVLTTATFVSTGHLDIALPQSQPNAESIVEEMEVIELAVDRDEQIYLNGERVAISDVEVYLQSSDEKKAVSLVIDETVEFRHFVALIDLLKDRSPDKVSIRTRTVP